MEYYEYILQYIDDCYELCDSIPDCTELSHQVVCCIRDEMLEDRLAVKILENQFDFTLLARDARGEINWNEELKDVDFLSVLVEVIDEMMDNFYFVIFKYELTNKPVKGVW